MTDEPTPQLKRSLGFWALLAYGVGDILGAGIYALVGKVAGAAGSSGWMSFGVAMFVASLTGLTYAELVSRHPVSAGEAHFCRQAFGRPGLALWIGWLVFCSGVVSLSAVTHAFADYLHELVPAVPEAGVWTVFLLALAGLNFRGIRESSSANIVFTLIEASGLVLVLIAGVTYLSAHGNETVVVENANASGWLGVFAGGALAFFAFIGFEDMVNVAEEVKEPQRHFPKAIIAAVLVTGTVYMAVAFIATSVVPPNRLAEAEAPLLSVVRVAAPSVPGGLYTLIALFAVANTGLLNFIMASRLVYGMAQRGLLPIWLGAVHRRRNTPHRAIGLIALFAAVLVFSGTLTHLAGATSALLLAVFFTVNLSLVVIRLRERARWQGFRVPLAIPITGAATCAALAAFVKGRSWLLAAAVAAVGLLVVGIHAVRSQRTSNRQMNEDG